ncbi:amino acid ABC transporter permease [Vallitalea pronyensis]|uniref:Amino acid ABC transporter permease n=1 Tax=Vallitalea pronyensis TaxID=1348613 RepID=A0A8J8MLK5_9FIRM|nr:amino acid ABC transporter permease [Vallitalea pronyensis]QUI23990.1 amino acid ABC transporter permease [Vallitalea pronyensis]
MRQRRDKQPKTINKVCSMLLVGCILIGFLWLSISRIGLKLDFTTLFDYRQRLWQGFKMSIIISIGSLVVSLLIGTITAIGQQSKILSIRYLCKVYVQIIRGTPLLVQIYFFYYIIGTAWGVDNRYIAGILILSIFEGAYISEIIRGGVQSIDAKQYEIARAIGLTSYRTLQLVTLPILMARILPALAGQFASIIKDSSLLSVIAIIELTQTIQEISADNFRMFENYIFIGLLYFIMTFAISLLSGITERRVKYAYKAQ